MKPVLGGMMRKYERSAADKRADKRAKEGSGADKRMDRKAAMKRKGK